MTYKGLFGTFLIIIMPFVLSCKNEQAKLVETVAMMKGQKVIIPDCPSFKALEDIDINSYAIIEYIDSSSCMSCSFKISEWNVLAKEYLKINSDMRFIFILRTKPTKDIYYALKWEQFNYPVIFDREGQFEKVNNLPHNRLFHTLLIDKNRNVLVVGNPINNFEIDSLYRSEIVK